MGCVSHHCHQCGDITVNNSSHDPKLCLECGCTKFLREFDEKDDHHREPAYEQEDLDLDEWEEE